ncbi:MAG: ferritin-like domain-containing protein [Clostridiales bacterium]|uniref:ferritin family protein n=1 Tax=Clostridia TaxID=186801 RepID=UPI0004675429|nr:MULTISPECIES: ferritin-like domain-containing protein [Clostridia]MBS5957926.1 ferritin-like domain-containing protein [Clostridiales bacterium]
MKEYDFSGMTSEHSPFMNFTETIYDQKFMDMDIYNYPENLANAMELMKQALNGEVEDQMFYMWLISNAKTEEERQIIGSIRDDEVGHFELFRQIYYDLTGMDLRQESEETFIPPESYCDGIARALLGEQNAVRNYRKILYAMQSRIHINMLIDIITDEIRHGILYNYLFSRNGC